MTAKVQDMINELVSQGRWDEAYSVVSGHASQNLQDPSAQFQFGSFCYLYGRFSEAERILKQNLAGPMAAEAYYYLGLTMLKLNRLNEAVTAFRDACEKKENFALAHLHWGIALAQQESWRGALGQFKQAIKIDPKLYIAHYEAGIAAYKSGSFAEAEQSFLEAKNLDSTGIDAWVGLAMVQVALNKNEEALNNFEKAWQADSSQAFIKRHIASLLMRMGRFDDASRQLNEVLNTSTQVIEARDRSLIFNDWGVSLFQQGYIEEAAEKLLQAVSIDPDSIDSRINLGLVNVALNEYEQAKEEFQKVLDVQANNLYVKMQMGIIAFFQNDFSEALAEFESALEQGLDISSLRLWLGYAEMTRLNFASAELHFSKVLQELPNNVLALDALGVCHAFQERHDEAMQCFQKCVNVQSNYALAHLHLARSYESAGQLNDALEEYKKAVAKDPRCFLPEKELVEELLKQMQFEIVESKTSRLLELLPRDEETYIALAKALKGLQRPEESMQVLNSLLQLNSKNGHAFILQGQLFLSQGLLLDADEKYRMASEILDGDVVLYYGWGKTLGLLGMHELALEKFAKANEIDPFDADTYEAWGATLKILGRYQEAAEVYKKAAEYI